MIASSFFTQLLHPLGTCTGTPGQITGCRGYNAWSGIISDISEITLIIGLIMLIIHHTCHVGLCLRPGRHPVEGTGYKVCRRHHPDIQHKGRTTAEHIRHAFNAAKHAPHDANILRDARGRFSKAPQTRRTSSVT